MKRHLTTYILVLTSSLTYGQTNIDLTIKRDTFQYFSILDTNFHKYQLPDNFKKPKKWIKVDKERTGFLGDWYGNKYSDTFGLKDALAIIDTATQLSQIGSAKSWCINNYQKAFPFLVARLSDKRKIGLTNTGDLIIWDRLGTSDLEFYGHGGSITEDIFTIAGRASWILNQLTGEIFAEVHGNLTEKQSEEFKKLWVQYIDKLKK
ncbi:hypothetical protein [Rubrolithibacter danxiaensis]|uniref:hypothetical protein n=1 Tax=Rubrolithibacter danxiaensis TaxID=3390805 RepID=UPI003BF7AC8C